MIAWLAGTGGSERYSAPSIVPLSQWSAVLQRELHTELHLAPNAVLGLEFLELATAVLPSDFEADTDAESAAQLALEAIYNFVDALRLPRTAERFAFNILANTARPVLVKRTPQSLQVTMLTLTQYECSARLRRTQLRALVRRRGSAVLEQISTSRGDLRQPSAAHCAVALIAEHLAPHRAGMPALADLVPATAPALLIEQAQRGAANLCPSGAALTGLLQLYLCDAANIGVCNDLLEEATTFAQRLNDANGGEQLARLASLMPRYAAQLRGCALTTPQLVAVVRDIARALFGVDTTR